MGDFVTLDTSNFKTVGKHLRKVAPELARELNRELKRAGDVITVAARAEAESFSTHIAPNIKTQRRGMTVKIVVGPGKAPHLGEGPAYEGDGLNRARLRHPVFGNREVWANGETHPMVGPAFLKIQDVALNRIVLAIDRLLEQL